MILIYAKNIHKEKAFNVTRLSVPFWSSAFLIMPEKGSIILWDNIHFRIHFFIFVWMYQHDQPWQWQALERIGFFSAHWHCWRYEQKGYSILYIPRSQSIAKHVADKRRWVHSKRFWSNVVILSSVADTWLPLCMAGINHKTSLIRMPKLRCIENFHKVLF